MNILVIPDLHCPWHHPHAFDFLRDLARHYSPDEVVCVGDEVDCHRWSSHPQDPDMPGPGDEIGRARQALKPLYKLFPKVKVCESNHAIRPFRKASEAFLPAHFLRLWRDILEAPKGWEWRLRWLVRARFDAHTPPDVVFIHGDGFSGENGAKKAAQHYRRCVVMGHIHSFAGVNYLWGPYDRIWAMNVGCLIDPEAPAFSYGKHMARRPTLGAGVIVDGVPQFVPMTEP